MKTAFLFAVSAFLMVSPSASQASPENALNCPSGKPTSNSECADDSITGCKYTPFSCPESEEVIYLDSCSCDSGEFICSSAFVVCESKPPTEAPTSQASTANALNCPSEQPFSNSECADDSITGCGYNPFSCPESRDEVTYRILCSCDTGKFRCSSSGIKIIYCEGENILTPSWCFSGESLVDVKGKGSIQMKNLKIGDMVHTGNSNYEQVYSFGHYAPDTFAQFLQVHVKDALTPLSISSDHMVFVKSRGGFVPASHLKEGDKLVDGAGNELSVASIDKKDKVLGVFAPFTPSGKIVVNDILASSFVAMDSKLTIGGAEFSNQWIARTFEFPHRVACHYMGQCPNEVYDEDGISMWVSTPHKIGQWVLTQNSLIRNMFFASLVAVLSVFAVVEALFVYPASLVIVVAAAHFYYNRRGQNKAPV